MSNLFLSKVSSIGNQIRNSQSLTNRIYRGGPGGISSFNNRIITVFGAYGYLGQSIVAKLGKAGCQIIVPYRGIEQTKLFLRIAGDLGQVHLKPFDPYNLESIKNCLEYSDTVISCVGNHVNRYIAKKSNIEAPQMIARAVAQSPNVKSFTHVSCLTQNQPNSDVVSRTKNIGEKLVKLEYPDVVIVRPATMYNHYDSFTTYIMRRRTMLSYYVFKKLEKVIKRPVYGIDVARAISKIAMEQKYNGSIFELYSDDDFYLGDIKSFVDCVHIKYYNFRVAYMFFPITWAAARLMNPRFALSAAFLPPTMETSEIPSLDSRIHTFKDLEITPVHPDEGIRRAVTWWKTLEGMLPHGDNDYHYEDPDLQLICKSIRDSQNEYSAFT